ncbi:MAG: methyl-accepting chemotaxis protein [Desulfuromonadaceae bacterium]|nr:methyl-accepting chemotaxis protein [Desulfuromonadaceae bacterium]
MLKSLSIRTKLFLSFICLLLLIVGVSAVGKIAMDNGAYSSANLQTVTSIEALFNQARIAEKNFAVTADEEFATSVRTSMHQLTTRTEQLTSQLKQQAAISASEQIKLFSSEYLTAFDAYASKSQAREEAMEEMKDASNGAFEQVKLLQDKLNARLSDSIETRENFVDNFSYELALGAIMEQVDQTQTINLLFLNARKFEKEHIISNNTLFFERGRQSIEMMRTMLNNLLVELELPDLIEIAKLALEETEKYSENFEQHAALMAEQAHLSTTMEDKASGANTACLSAMDTIEASNVASMKFSQTMLLGITLAAIICGILFAITISRSIAVPLIKTVTMINALAHGRLDQRLNLGRSDEIGTLAATMDSFADSLEHEVVEPLNKLAQGDLTFSVKPYDQKDQLRTALQKLGEDLNSIILEIQVAGTQIRQGSSQVADSSQSLSQGATEQASSLEQISSSLHEVSDQTKRNAELSREANSLTEQVRSDATIGSGHMQQLNEAMLDITKASRDISNIIKAIDAIAFQTNLLALNAAVEAARAGQHGKGFAVVAEEVRNLAARSAKAAQETADLIQGSVDKADHGAAIAGRTRDSLEKIVTGVTKASTLVAEISVASNEQAEAINQISIGVSQIDDVTQQNTANVEQTAAAATQLSSQANNLQQMLSRFVLSSNSGSTPFTPAPAAPSKSIRQPRLSAPESTFTSNTEDEESTTNGWGHTTQSKPPRITLDDDDFGRF